MGPNAASISNASPASSDLCLLCGLPLIPRFSGVRDAESGEDFSILQCPQCGLGHTRPVPAELGRYYAAGYRGQRHGFTEQYCARRRLGLVHRTAGAGDGRKLLDIGCGEGTFLLRARRAGWQVTGTELEPELARSHNLPVGRSLAEIADAAPFDCITLWHSLEHMLNPRDELQQAAAMLNPAGTMLIAVPDAGGWQATAFGEDWLHLDVPRHLHHFTQGSLRRLLQACGLKVMRSWHQELEYDLLGWSQSALNRWSGTHNVFFDALRGRRDRWKFWQRAMHSLAGLLAATIALPLLPAAAASKRGGTLIFAAKKM